VTAADEKAVALDDCYFYHTLELPSFGRVEGSWDLTGRYDEYTAGVEVDGKTVFDVGTASGFLTWEAEKRGATVTSFDVDDPEHLFMLPFRGSERLENPTEWRGWYQSWIQRMRNGYWLAHRDLDSNAECVYGNVYEITPELGQFDVVMVGQLLVHLPDGISALAAAASVCRETIVVTEGSFPADDPLASLCGRVALPDIPYAWYHYSYGWYREVLAMLGFRTVEITAGQYRCNEGNHADLIELATIVGKR